MTVYNFGIGALIGRRNDISGTIQPAFFGTITDVNIDFDRKIEFLVGQYNVPVAAGGGELKIAGKAKNARFQATFLNNIFMGTNTLTTQVGQMVEMAIAENHLVPNGSPFTVTMTNSSGWLNDLGVFYATPTGLQGGVQLTPVSTALSVSGQYSTNAGVYFFFSTDAGASLNFYYNYSTSVSGASQISLTNALMGPVPTFELNLKESFTFFGTQKNIIVRLNACVSPKLTWPFANSKFSMQEFDFQAITDAANNVGTISITE